MMVFCFFFFWAWNSKQGDIFFGLQSQHFSNTDKCPGYAWANIENQQKMQILRIDFAIWVVVRTSPTTKIADAWVKKTKRIDFEICTKLFLF